MSEETKNTVELTDKQLEKVAGGKGGSKKRYVVIRVGGAKIYSIMDTGSNRIGSYKNGTILQQYDLSCDQSGVWVFVIAQEGQRDGYVLKSDLLLI